MGGEGGGLFLAALHSAYTVVSVKRAQVEIAGEGAPCIAHAACLLLDSLHADGVMTPLLVHAAWWSRHAFCLVCVHAPCRAHDISSTAHTRSVYIHDNIF